jgi:hypothetical protein
MKSKKGYVIVEAAIYFPIVIAAVISVLYIVIGMYQSVILQTSIHLAVRQAVGEASGTVIRSEEAPAFDQKEQKIGLRKSISIGEEKTYTINTIFRNELTRQESGRAYVIDEVGMLRIVL